MKSKSKKIIIDNSYLKYNFQITVKVILTNILGSGSLE